MGKKDRGPKREYKEEVKVETVRLAEAIGGNAAASRTGVPQPTVKKVAAYFVRESR